MKKRHIKVICGGFLFFTAISIIFLSADTLRKITYVNTDSISDVAYTDTSIPVIRMTSPDLEQAAKIGGVSAQSAILIDGLSGNVLYEKNAYKRLPMASTTKVTTAIVALESGVPLDKVFYITKEMTGAEGSSIYLYEGERFTLEDLIYAVLLNSANDAATAVAFCVAGSVEAFADMMNEKVRELGLTNTNYKNPHGLDDELHYTTAYDLAVISAYALKNDKFREITSSKNHVIYPKNEDGSVKEEGTRYLRNHNRMLNFYSDTIGVKTGFTKRSGRCLVSAAERENVRLVAVTINAPSDWSDHMNMLDYGFFNYKSIILCEEKELEYYVDIVNGVISDSDVQQKKQNIKCVNKDKIYSSFPKETELEDIEEVVELPQFMYAPVKKGDKIGKITYYYNNQIIGISDIVSDEDVEEEQIKKSFIDKIRDFFTRE